MKHERAPVFRGCPADDDALPELPAPSAQERRLINEESVSMRAAPLDLEGWKPVRHPLTIVRDRGWSYADDGHLVSPNGTIFDFRTVRIGRKTIPYARLHGRPNVGRVSA